MNIKKYEIEMTEEEEGLILYALQKNGLTSFYEIFKKIYDRGDMRDLTQLTGSELKWT